MPVPRTSSLNRIRLGVMRFLARAAGESWASCPLGPSDEEILQLGLEISLVRWQQRLAFADQLDREMEARGL